MMVMAGERCLKNIRRLVLGYGKDTYHAVRSEGGKSKIAENANKKTHVEVKM